MLLLRYLTETGEITSLWQGTSMASLKVTAQGTDPQYAYLFHADMPLQVVQQQYYVREGALVQKMPVTMQATPSPFPADGTTVCSVVLTPFLPCVAYVNDVPYSLTDSDPHLELTAEVPAHVTILLALPVTHWAEPLVVEAV